LAGFDAGIFQQDSVPGRFVGEEFGDSPPRPRLDSEAELGGRVTVALLIGRVLCRR